MSTSILQLLKDLLFPKNEEKEKSSTAGAAATEKRTEEASSGAGKKPAKAGDYGKMIKGLVSDAGYGKYTPVGSTKAICPSCGSELEKVPPRKIQCPSCNKDIFVRTRESDKKKVLLKGEQLDEFEAQRIFDSGRYDRRIAKLIEDTERYAAASGGWVFVSALAENENPVFVELHGKVIKSGSNEETEALRLLIRPESRARTKTWFNDAEKDTDWKEFEQQKKDWFDNRKKQ